MFYAQKGNQVSRIEEFQIAELLEQGFNIIDEKGSVLHEAVPTDLNILKRAFVDNRKRIAELEAEIESLKKSSAKKATPKVEEKAEEVAEDKTEEEVVVTKRGRGAKK